MRMKWWSKKERERQDYDWEDACGRGLQRAARLIWQGASGSGKGPLTSSRTIKSTTGSTCTYCRSAAMSIYS